MEYLRNPKKFKELSLKVVKSLISYIIFGTIYVLGSKKTASSNYNFPLLQTACGNSFCSMFVGFIVVITKPPEMIDLNYFIDKRMLIIGILSGIDNGLSNLSFKHVSVLIYAIVKSSVPIFILILSIYFKLEKTRFLTILSISLLCVGVVIASLGKIINSEKKSNILGIIYVIIAAVCQACRFVYMQTIVQKKTVNEGEKEEESRCSNELDSVLIMFYTSPISATILILLSLFFEIPELFKKIPEFSTDWYFYFVATYLSLSIVASFLTLSQFKTIEYFSSLTLTVTAKIREIILLFLSLLIFGDKWDIFTIVGYSLVFVGVVLYNVLKIMSARKRVGRSNVEKNTREDMVSIIKSLSDVSTEMVEIEKETEKKEEQIFETS